MITFVVFIKTVVSKIVVKRFFVRNYVIVGQMELIINTLFFFVYRWSWGHRKLD